MDRVAYCFLLLAELQDLFLKQPKHCIKYNKGGVEILLREGTVDSYNIR